MFHMALATPDLQHAADACKRAGVPVARETRSASADALWTAPAPALGVPVEFRQTAAERDR
jgi:hypothetical protein